MYCYAGNNLWVNEDGQCISGEIKRRLSNGWIIEVSTLETDYDDELESPLLHIYSLESVLQYIKRNGIFPDYAREFCQELKEPLAKLNAMRERNIDDLDRFDEFSVGAAFLVIIGLISFVILKSFIGSIVLIACLVFTGLLYVLIFFIIPKIEAKKNDEYISSGNWREDYNIDKLLR